MNMPKLCLRFAFGLGLLFMALLGIVTQGFQSHGGCVTFVQRIHQGNSSVDGISEKCFDTYAARAAYFTDGGVQLPWYANATTYRHAMQQWREYESCENRESDVPPNCP
jgi:hypothetical protein